MDKESAQAYVRTMLTEFLKVPEEQKKAIDRYTPLTGEPICLDVIELTYLFLEIEKRLNIRISPEQISDYQFCTISGIADCIVACMARTER